MFLFPSQGFQINQKVLASWSDCRYYPAKILSRDKDGQLVWIVYKKLLGYNSAMVCPDQERTTDSVTIKHRCFGEESDIKLILELPARTTCAK